MGHPSLDIFYKWYKFQNKELKIVQPPKNIVEMNKSISF